MINMRKYSKVLSVSALIVGVYLLISLLLKIGIIDNYYGGILVLICINIIAALSLNLITGFTGQLCLGHAGFMSIGAYVGAMLSIKLSLPLPFVLILGGCGAALIAFIIGIPTLKLSGDYFAITTLALGEIIRVIITNIDYLGGPRGVVGIPEKVNFTWAYIVMIVTTLVIYNIIHSSQGRTMISVRENEIAAEAMGVNTFKVKLITFIIAAFFAGVAGALYAHYAGFLQPTSFGFIRSVEILTFVVFGGMGSLTGTFLATIILTFLPELLRSIQDLRMVIYSVALIVLMIFRPEGLMGTKELSLKSITKLFSKKPKEKEVV